MIHCTCTCYRHSKGYFRRIDSSDDSKLNRSASATQVPCYFSSILVFFLERKTKTKNPRWARRTMSLVLTWPELSEVRSILRESLRRMSNFSLQEIRRPGSRGDEDLRPPAGGDRPKPERKGASKQKWKIFFCRLECGSGPPKMASRRAGWNGCWTATPNMGSHRLQSTDSARKKPIRGKLRLVLRRVWLKIHQGQTAGFGPCFHLPRFRLGTGLLSHSQKFQVFQQELLARIVQG